MQITFFSNYVIKGTYNIFFKKPMTEKYSTIGGAVYLDSANKFLTLVKKYFFDLLIWSRYAELVEVKK